MRSLFFAITAITIEIWAQTRNRVFLKNPVSQVRRLFSSISILINEAVDGYGGAEYSCHAASSDKAARLWNLEGKQIGEFVGHTNEVNGVSFSPDGKMLATASDDRTARLWPVESLEELLARGCEWLRGYFVNHPEALAELEACRGQD